MRMGFRVTVEIGPRTPTRVSAYHTGVNKKVAKFANGEKISSARIEEWLEEQLLIALKKIEDETR